MFGNIHNIDGAPHCAHCVLVSYANATNFAFERSNRAKLAMKLKHQQHSCSTKKRSHSDSVLSPTGARNLCSQHEQNIARRHTNSKAPTLSLPTIVKQRASVAAPVFRFSRLCSIVSSQPKRSRHSERSCDHLDAEEKRYGRY